MKALAACWAQLVQELTVRAVNQMGNEKKVE